jgi:hypothetical protein
MPAINPVNATMSPSPISGHVPVMPANDFLLQILNIGNSSESPAEKEAFGRSKKYAHGMAYRGHLKVKRDITQSPEDQTKDVYREIELAFPNETSKCFDAKRILDNDLITQQLSASRFKTTFIKKANTPLCQFLYRHPPTTTTPPPTTMCDWGAIIGTAQGTWSFCRPKVSSATPAPSQKVNSATP